MTKSDSRRHSALHEHGPSSAHTKSPWIVSTSTNEQVYDGEEHLIVLSHPEFGTGQIIADIESSANESAANARLIAAAPDTLKCTKALLLVCDDRLSMLKEEEAEALNGCDDEQEIKDEYSERRKHYRLLKKDAMDAIGKTESA